MTTACSFAKNVINRPEVRRKTVHIIIKDGMVYDAYADANVDIIVYNLDTEDSDMQAEVKRAVDALTRDKENHEIEIL